MPARMSSGDELRAALRAARLEVIDHTADPLATVRRTALLRRLRPIGSASARAMLAIEILAGQHSCVTVAAIRHL
jgi:hypothetical protein